MSYKLYGREVFEANVNGVNYVFTCYGQDTRYGFRHIVTRGYNDTTDASCVRYDIIAKACYYNRTWERFRYESVLRSAIEKVTKDEEIRKVLHNVIIEKKAKEEHEKCEAMFGAFKTLYDGLSDTNKDKLKDTFITSEAQARLVMLEMAMMQEKKSA